MCSEFKENHKQDLTALLSNKLIPRFCTATYANNSNFFKRPTHNYNVLCIQRYYCIVTFVVRYPNVPICVKQKQSVTLEKSCDSKFITKNVKIYPSIKIARLVCKYKTGCQFFIKIYPKCIKIQDLVWKMLVLEHI